MTVHGMVIHAILCLYIIEKVHPSFMAILFPNICQ